MMNLRYFKWIQIIFGKGKDIDLDPEFDSKDKKLSENLAE